MLIIRQSWSYFFYPVEQNQNEIYFQQDGEPLHIARFLLESWYPINMVLNGGSIEWAPNLPNLSVPHFIYGVMLIL